MPIDPLGLSDLNGRIALVTGSSRGIGQAVAVRLAEAGAVVGLNATKDVSATERAVREAGGRSFPCIGDISKAEEVERISAAIVAQHGFLDVLVCNAGINRDGLILRMSDDDWDAVLDTNLRGAFLCVRAAVKHMVRKRWGRVITMGSVVAYRGNAGQSNYAAAKSGLIGFTRSVAHELAGRGITANVVAPGFIDTDMTRDLSEAQREQIWKRIPLGAFGTARDVAEVVAFLASEEAGYITGQVLYVDGGLSLA